MKQPGRNARRQKKIHIKKPRQLCTSDAMETWRKARKQNWGTVKHLGRKARKQSVSSGKQPGRKARRLNACKVEAFRPLANQFAGRVHICLQYQNSSHG